MPVAFKLQPQSVTQEVGDGLPRLVQLLLVRAEQGDVVHVAGHRLHARHGADEVVQRFQIVVRQPLANVVADGQPAAAGFDNGVDSAQEPLILDFPGKRPDQALGRNAWVVVMHIQFSSVLAPLLIVPQSAPDMFLDARCTAAGDGSAGPVIPPAHQYRPHGLDQKPVHHTVRPEWYDLDDPPLLAALIVDLFLVGRRRDETLRRDHLIGFVYIFVDVLQNAAHLAPLVLVPCGLVDGGPDEIPIHHLFVEESNSFWHLSCSLFVCKVFRAAAY